MMGINTPLKHIIAFYAMVIGMFMAILDIQIVASSISVIGAGLSASHEELAWIQTSYLMAEVVVIPMSGFFSKALSTRVSYTISIIGFTLCSVACAFAWNIESMIACRALQGFFGGALIPAVFATSFTIFPREKQGIISVVIGLTATMAPTLGPTIGGYITEISSWHNMFLVNVIPGIFVTIIIYRFADFDKPKPEMFKNFDYYGVLIIIVTLASLQYVLEEGNNKDWFDSTLILSLSVLIICGFVLLIYWELKFSNPILGLSAFKNKNFVIGCLFSAIMGIGLYGTVYLTPLYLHNIAGMDTLEIGIVMMVTGLFQLISAPLAGRLFDAGMNRKLMLFIGFSLLGLGCYLNSFMTAESRYWEFFLPQAVRGISLMFCFIPINNIALGTMPPSEVHNASGLYNLMRNLGGAIGLAIMNTYLNNQANVFKSYIAENMTATNPIFVQSKLMLEHMLQWKSYNPEQASLKVIDMLINQQAFIIAYNNVFFLIAMLFLGSMWLISFANNVQEK